MKCFPLQSPPTDYIDGPMPTISDSLFSLIILIYVGVIFVVMFFAFCWKEPEPPPPNPAHKNIPMITSMLEEMEKQEMAAKAAEVASEAEEAAQAASSEALIGNMQPELTNGNGTTGNGTTTQEATEMKELSSNDKVNVISEKKELNNVGNSEAATSVWKTKSESSHLTIKDFRKPSLETLALDNKSWKLRVRQIGQPTFAEFTLLEFSLGTI